MLCRTWPYGTVKPGKVLETVHTGPYETILFEADDSPEEVFALMQMRGPRTTRDGERGTITFVKGGPTGGYWRYQPA